MTFAFYIHFMPLGRKSGQDCFCLSVCWLVGLSALNLTKPFELCKIETSYKTCVTNNIYESILNETTINKIVILAAKLLWHLQWLMELTKSRKTRKQLCWRITRMYSKSTCLSVSLLTSSRMFRLKPQSDIRCNRFATSPRLTIYTNRRGRNKVPDRSR